MASITSWLGKILGPNTAPQASDNAVVVAISPNSPPQHATLDDVTARLDLLLAAIANPISQDTAGRQRVSVESSVSTGGATGTIQPGNTTPAPGDPAQTVSLSSNSFPISLASNSQIALVDALVALRIALNNTENPISQDMNGRQRVSIENVIAGQFGLVQPPSTTPAAIDAAQTVALSGNSAPIPISSIASPVVVGDVLVEIRNILASIANPISQDASTGRQRTTVDNIAAGLTGTIQPAGTTPAVGDYAQTFSLSPNSAPNTIGDMAASIKRSMAQVANPDWVDASTGRVRVSVDNAANTVTIPTVSTVSQLGSLQQIGTTSASGTVFDIMSLPYLDGVRPRIT